jgi:hypothetical protein
MMVAGSPVDLSQPIEQKHAEFFGRIKERGQVCGLRDGVISPSLEHWDLGAMASATRSMTTDVRKLSVSYGCRSEIHQTRKDVLNLAIRLNRVDTKVIVDDIFMFYAKAFDAEHASCYDSRLGAWSFKSGCDIYSLMRRVMFIEQLNWISNCYAWEKLQISAKEIGKRVEPAAERVEYIDDGVYIVLDSRPLTMAEAKEKTLAANLALYPEIAPIIPSLRAIYADE